MKPQRLNWSIRWSAEDKAWSLWCEGKCAAVYRPGHCWTKKKAVADAAETLADLLAYDSIRSELTIFTKSGRIGKDKRSYGDDPKETKG